MIKNRNIDPGAFIDPTKIAMFGCGEVYHVCRAADTSIKNWLNQRVPGDHLFFAATSGADIAINKALSACVEGRNDYVVIWPSNSDYDLTAVITLNKKCVNLVAPGGFTYERGAGNAVRIHQNTAATAVFAVSDANVQIAGFYVKNYAGIAAITLAATSYAPNINHNTFVISLTTSNAAIIAGTGDAGGWGKIEKNLFLSYAGTSQTIAKVIDIGASATCAQVLNNDFVFGDSNTITVAVYNDAVKGLTAYNNFSSSGGDATLTNAIYINAKGAAIKNMVAAASGCGLSGGTAGASFCQNFDGRSTSGTDIWNLEA